MNRIIFSSFHLLLLVLFIGGSIADPLSDVACNYVNCGEGTCLPSNVTFPPYECKCNPGWKKIQLGPTTFPSCSVPNCTIDFSCGPPPLSVPQFNLTDPCTSTWCGDGTCVASGTSYICKCNPKATNLLNKTNLACFRDCYFGDDCRGLGYGPQQPSPLPSPLPPNSPTPNLPKNDTETACNFVNCGEGTCVPSNVTFPLYDCKCNPGWKKIQLGPITFPSCTVPNCTIDFSCGPPPPQSVPRFNLTDPCNLTWCGDGTCVASGTSYICKCNPKATNLLNKTSLACFRDCYFGDDCRALGFGPQQPSPLPTPLPSPLPPNSPTPDFPKNGTGPSNVPNSSSTQQSLTALLLFGIFLQFIL